MIKRKKINRFEQPPKITISIKSDSEAVVRQTYDVTTGEYYPNRTLFPLVLTPIVGYYHPDTGQRSENAAKELVNGHWYRLDNSTDGTLTAKNEITSGSLYSIDTTVGSATYGQLTIRENIPAGNPVTFVFAATLKRTDSYSVTDTFHIDTEQIEVLPKLYFDNNRQALYNPWDSTQIRLFTINPKIQPDKFSVTYRWYYLLNGTWQELGASPEHYAVTRSGNGVVIDRSIMPDEISLKCVAAIPVKNGTIELDGIITQRRRLPKFDYDIAHIADILEGTTLLNPKALIRSNRNVISDPGDEVSVNWYGSGTASIATGINPQISVGSLGSDMELGLEILDNGGYKVLIDDDKDYLLDDDGAYLLVK